MSDGLSHRRTDSPHAGPEPRGAHCPTLAATRNGRIVEVGPHWFFHGPVAATLMLGDLERMHQ